MADQNQEALAHIKEAEATLNTSSASGYPESLVARAIHKIRMGIAKLEGKTLAPKPEISPESINAIPNPNNRGDKGGAPVAAEDKPEVEEKPVVKQFKGVYEDGFTITGDRSTFPDVSPSGAKRVSVEPAQ